MMDEKRRQQLQSYGAGGRYITKLILISPVAAHFVKSASSLLSVSQSEVIRRIVDDALLKWREASLYDIPTEFLPPRIPLPQPSPSRVRRCVLYDSRTVHLLATST